MSTSGGGRNTNNDSKAFGGYRNNNRCGQGGNNNNNNNNGGQSRIQYDPSGQPMIQCRACNLWGHFARDCTMKGTQQLLCRWCGLGDHEDANCPKLGVNLLSIEIGNDEETLVITHAKEKMYPDSEEEKKRLQQARA